MAKNDAQQIILDFRKRQTRQQLAIAVTLLCIVLLVLVYRRPDLFTEVSKSLIAAAQISLIAVFVAFTAINWRCPACKKYLGADIAKGRCPCCGARLQ